MSLTVKVTTDEKGVRELLLGFAGRKMSAALTIAWKLGRGH